MKQDTITKALIKGVKTGKLVAKYDGWTLSWSSFIGAIENRAHFSPEAIVYSLPS